MQWPDCNRKKNIMNCTPSTCKYVRMSIKIVYKKYNAIFGFHFYVTMLLFLLKCYNIVDIQ